MVKGVSRYSPSPFSTQNHMTNFIILSLHQNENPIWKTFNLNDLFPAHVSFFPHRGWVLDDYARIATLTVYVQKKAHLHGSVMQNSRIGYYFSTGWRHGRRWDGGLKAGGPEEGLGGRRGFVHVGLGKRGVAGNWTLGRDMWGIFFSGENWVYHVGERYW